MNEVIEFPLKRTLEKKLHDQMEVLDILYDELNAQHVMLNDLELNANNIEKNFNKLLAKYARMVGVDSIPIGFLQYSTEARIYLGENNQFEVSFDPEDEDEDEGDN